MITTKEPSMGLSDSTVHALLAVSDLDRARSFYEHPDGNTMTLTEVSD
jgi:hypothetical protein